MIANFFLIGLRHKAITCVILFLISIFFVFGVQRLSIDTGFQSLIPKDDPNKLTYQHILQDFGTDNKTIVYLKDSDLWSVNKLTALQALHKSIAKLKHVKRIDSLVNLHTLENIDGNIQTSTLLRQLPSNMAEASLIKEKALKNPLFIGNYLSQDETTTALIVSMKNNDDEADISLAFYNDLEEVINEYKNTFKDLFQVGPPRISSELKQSLFEDFTLLAPLSALILMVSIIIFMRSFMAAIIPLTTSTLSILWTFGMMGWCGIPVNILSAMLPSLIIVIGSTEDTHIISAYFRGQKTEQGKKDAAIRYMARHIGLPLILTVVTTALGFASNSITDIGIIKHFAYASTFAMIANGLITLILVPIMLSVLSKDTDSGAMPNHVVFTEKIVQLFKYSRKNYPGLTIAITIFLCGFFIFQAAKLYVTNDPLSYFPKDRPLIQQTIKIHEDLAGIKLFFITLEAERSKAFYKPENIQKLHEIQEFIKRQGAFDQSLSIADHLKFIHQEFSGGNPDKALPGSSKLIAQYLMFLHRNDIDNYINHDLSKANIVVRHNIHDSFTLNNYVDELKDVVSEISGAEIKTYILSENLMVNDAAETLMVAQVKALTLLLALIFIIMSVMFTSLKGGAIALVPAIIPISLMFGVMGLLNIPLNPGTAMVAVIAIGIAIDGTIHLLARYNELCRHTSDYVDAVDTAVKEEATPLIVSCLALSFGFGILLFSNFSIIAQFGALSAATMIFSIFANLLITPILMTHIRLVGLYQILGMRVDRQVLESSPLFMNMTNYQRRKAVLISQFSEFKEGELILEQDTVGREMYLILSGETDVIRRDGETENHLATLQAGTILGEIGYIKATNRSADVRAKTDVTALKFDYERMQKDLKFFPNIVAKLNFNISYVLGDRLANMVENSTQPK